MFGHEHAAAAHRHPGRGAASCSRSPRSASTASCSPAGPPARRTRCSAACARRAQMISYEIAMGLSLVAVFLYAGSMSTSEIVAAQHEPVVHHPGVLRFVIYVISMVGETNRRRSTSPEAEGELVGGFHTEYSLAEVRAVLPRPSTSTWSPSRRWPPRCSSAAGSAPWPIAAIWRRLLNDGWWPLLWFVVKLLVLHVRLRLAARHAAAAALRPVHAFGWKLLIPVSLRLDRRWSRSSARSAQRRLARRPRRSWSAARSSSLVGVIAVLAFVGWHVGTAGEAEDDGAAERPRSSTRSPAATRCRRCPASALPRAPCARRDRAACHAPTQRPTRRPTRG